MIATSGTATTTAAPFLTRPYWNWHQVNSVFDHCLSTGYYSPDGQICEVDGTVALKSNGVDPYFTLGYATTPGGSNYLYYDGHDGWDLGLDYEPVLAAAPGTVVYAGYDSSGWGNTILIDHGNGFKTRYAHLSTLSVAVNQTVTRGQQIGVSGSTGNSTGPHLHFGVYRTDQTLPNGQMIAVDPWGWQASSADPWPYDRGDLWVTGNPVNPVPTAPTSVTATAGVGTITVSWTAPTFDGGSGITAYTVTPSSGGTPVTLSGSATSTVFSNLTMGTQYTFTVTAASTAGSGPASAPSNSAAALPPFNGQWDDLGGVTSSAPAIASWSAGRLDVFVRGTDGALWHRWYDGAWHGWEWLGGQLIGQPAVASWGPGRLDVFADGTDGQLWHKWWDGVRWNGWEALGGGLSAGPGAASPGWGQVSVVVAGGDHQVWIKQWNGSAWSAWQPLGGVTYASPSLASWGSGRLDAVVRGTDNQLWHLWNDGGWHGWEALGGQLGSAPAATSEGPGLLEIFAVGMDGALYGKSWQGSFWTGWGYWGGSWPSGPGIAAQAGSGSVDGVVAGPGGAVMHANLGSY